MLSSLPVQMIREWSWSTHGLACSPSVDPSRSVRRSSNNCPVELLDVLDQARYESLGILDALNEFGRLSDAEQDAYLGIWEYAGLDSAQRLLTALLGEGHNQTWVVRDLDGTLRLLWQVSSSSDRWAAQSSL